MSCGEIERLFLAGAPAEDVHRHAKGCPTCRTVSADIQVAEQMSAGLQAPALPVALRSRLLAIPRATVSGTIPDSAVRRFQNRHTFSHLPFPAAQT